MHLALTGGSGFVGRHVVAAARKRGDRVTVLSRHPSAATERLGLDARDVTHAELTDPGSLTRALGTRTPDVVVHAAALLEGPRERLRAVNVDGTAALLEAMRPLPGPPRLVFVSSFAVEDTPPTPYSDSKRDAEDLVRASDLPFVILRPTLIYGPGDAQHTERLAARLRQGSMWLPAGGRTHVQPVHVDDVASACLAAADRDVALGRTYRLGGAEPIRVGDWRRAVRDASGGHARIRTIPLPLFALAARALALLGRPSALGVLAFHRAEHVVDSRAAATDLGYAPRDVRTGLRQVFGAR